MKIMGKKLFLFDIDGTVSLDETFFLGAIDFFSRIESNGGKAVFITNNSTRSIADYVAKFTRMGARVDEQSFVTASSATVRVLQKRYAGKKIFLVGTESLRCELLASGVEVTTHIEAGIAAALIGFDDELRYDKLRTLCELLYTQEVDLLATNPDLACPVSFGAIPDCGAICNMVECATGRKSEYLGKPSPEIVHMCLERTGFSAGETLVVGDRLYTDIACGINANVETVVVFTGEAKVHDLESTPFQPTYAFADISALSDAVIF